MYSSKKIHSLSAILTGTALIFIGLVTAAPAPQSATTTDTVTLKGTITAIDKATRAVTLKGPDGNFVTVHAGDKVKRFSDLKIGDQVTATYTESIAWSVRPAGQPAPLDSTQTAITSRAAGPGGTAAIQRNVTVTVQQINPAAPSVTVMGSDGLSQTFRVRDPKNLENLKIGDKVDVTYTQALLIRVDPAK